MATLSEMINFKLILFIFLFFSVNSVSGQKYDSIALEDIVINDLKIHSNITSLNTFDSISYEIDQFMGDTLKFVHVLNSYFVYRDRKLESFRLKDDFFELSNHGIKVGMNENVLKEKFPNSYKNKYQVKDGECVNIRIVEKSCALIFILNANKISEILFIILI